MTTAPRLFRLFVLPVWIGIQALTPSTAQASPQQEPASMPAGLYSTFLDSTAKDGSPFHQDGHGFSLKVQNLQVQLNDSGLSVAPQGESAWSWGIQLEGFGRAGQTAALSAPRLA